MPQTIVNPLDDPLFDNEWIRLDLGTGKLYTTDPFKNPTQATGTDILGIGAAVKEIENTINENIPSYLIAGFGIILIAAGVYSLAK